MNEKRSERVQSIARAFQVLEILAESDNARGLSDIAQKAGHSQPTIHRSLRTLVDLGYVRQEPSRRYGLGPKLIRLGERAVRDISAWAQPLLEQVVRDLEESVNMAMLDGDRIVYIAHVPSPQSVRMFTEVGSRAYPHSTGVGKALLSEMPASVVEGIVARAGMPSFTPYTITDFPSLLTELNSVAKRGYAVDRQEQELGVRCIAVTIPESPTRMALSVSGPSTRMDDAMVERSVPILKKAAQSLSESLARD